MHALNEDGSLNAAILTNTRYRAGGFTFDNDAGEGAVPDARRIRHTGTVVLMRPSTFLSLVPSEDIRSVRHLSRPGASFGTPFLDVRVDDEDETAIPVIGHHEGRSRMTVIERMGDDSPIPVFLFLTIRGYSCRPREIEEEWMERIAAGVVREKTHNVVPEIVEGPLFEQALWLDANGGLRDLRFGGIGNSFLR